MARKHSTQTVPRQPGGWVQTIVPALTTAFFIGTMAAGITALHSRANSDRSLEPNRLLAVSTRRVDVRDAYTVTERFIGVLEPARHTRLAFERSGLVIEILFDEGDEITAGAIVARLDASKSKSQRQGLEARLTALEAENDLATVTLKRQTALRQKGWQSEQKYDEARFKAARLSASVRQVRAAIDSLDIDIAKSELIAPYSGRIAARGVDEGSVIAAGTPVMELMETAVRRVRVGISLQASRFIQPGTEYRLVSGPYHFNGILLSTRPDLQAGTRTVIALFGVQGAKKVPIGEIVELLLKRSITSPGAWLPVGALSEGRKGLWTVLTVSAASDGAMLVAREAVEILHVEGDLAYVQGNLSAAKRIVINGTNRIIPGQIVTLASNSGQQEARR